MGQWLFCDKIKDVWGWVLYFWLGIEVDNFVLKGIYGVHCRLYIEKPVTVFVVQTNFFLFMPVIVLIIVKYRDRSHIP